MCGIVGIVSNKSVSANIIGALNNLEYRGYDSAGISTINRGKINEQKVFAIKPLTFMNSSGICIKELIDYFKINVKDVFVFHDDMDIDLGKVKVKFGGSSAGHNGIESIDKNIGKNYSRVRIGIGRPKKNAVASDHVLDNFTNDEKSNVEKVTSNITESLSVLINKDLDLFSSKINQ